MVNLFFPRCCPVCDDIVTPAGSLICPGCQGQLHRVQGPRCKKCGKELLLSDAEYCLDCTRQQRSFDYGIALYHYNEAAAKSMGMIKYKNKREYLDFYSRRMAADLGRQLQAMGAQAFIPVPVHPSRKRQRGFNQAEELAKRLAALTGIFCCSDVLVRVKKTEPQKALTSRQRLQNLEQAFAVNPLPPGLRRVILVDDIYTTGSTVEACSRVLKKAGIQKIYFAVICIGADA